MPYIQYPNVPNAPGVPVVPRNPATSNAYAPTTTTAATADITVQSNSAEWQVVDVNGALQLQPDTYADFQIRAEAVIPDYPIEQGGFASYNQVQKPFMIKLTAIITGLQIDNGTTKAAGNDKRNTFLLAVKTLKESLNLSTVVTPDTVFDNAKLIDYNWSQRSDKGLTMLLVELVFKEVRQTATATVTTAKPDGQNKKAIGQVSPVVPTNQQASLAKPLAFLP